MDKDMRPSPEELLDVIQREERAKEKGRLKIFLGMAAGVGKTSAMLQEAQKLVRTGVQLVVGTVYTHGRKETAQLLEGLKVIPEKEITYKDITFHELDIDAILKLKPELVLIDELAHSNIPGSRHEKRWQDVLEILDNGIDVYTTLNVQHIESLKDVVEAIVGIPIKETVPDSIIEIATQIELIDITPEELLQRLKEGKVYLGEQPTIAIQHFFQEDRLAALREIVLRFAAEKVDHDLIEMVPSDRIVGWRPCERLLVAVSANQQAKKLIRVAKRLAFTLHAPWVAVHVNDGTVLDEDEQSILAKNLTLARELGAEVITSNDPDIGSAIERIARQKNVTHIIIGRSSQRSFFDLFRRYSLLDRLAKECTDIDLHIIRQEKGSSAHKRELKIRFVRHEFLPYVLSLGFVLLLTLFNYWMLPAVGYRVVGFIFLLGILLLSLMVRKGPIFFASLLYAAIWDFFFIPPQGTLGANAEEDNALLLLYFLTAVVAGIWTDRVREHQEMLLKREKSTEALYEIVREIASNPPFKQLLQSIKNRLEDTFDGTFEIIVKLPESGLDFSESSFLQSDNKEKNVVAWVFDNGKEAGWSTSTLPESKGFSIPLKGSKSVVGVLTYRPKARNVFPTLEERNFLHTVAQQIANYIETQPSS